MKITNLQAAPVYFTSRTVDEKPTVHTIEAAEVRKINDTERLALILKGQDHDLKLTARQVSQLARAFGDETDAWVGKQITVSPGEDDGLTVEAVEPGSHKHH